MAYDATDFVVTEMPAPVVRDPKTITDPRERVAYLRDFLRELPPERFSMYRWITRDGVAYDADVADLLHDCGTVACIGGWCEGLFRQTGDEHTHAAALLGLRPNEAGELFYAWGGPGLGAITRHMAADVLDHYLATGKIDWSVA